MEIDKKMVFLKYDSIVSLSFTTNSFLFLGISFSERLPGINKNYRKTEEHKILKILMKLKQTLDYSQVVINPPI